MFDTAFRRLIDAPLGLIARRLMAIGVGADALTASAFALGLAAIAVIAVGYPRTGLALFLGNRLLEGLAGAAARQESTTDLGSVLGQSLDLIVVAGMPFAFALADPSRALAASFAMLGLVASGATRLALALFAAKRGLGTDGSAFAEGGLVMLAFVIACLLPERFSIVAYILGVLGFVVAGAYVAYAITSLRRT
jgi:phosphatidylglycerophosphate synthase